MDRVDPCFSAGCKEVILVWKMGVKVRCHVVGDFKLTKAGLINVDN